MSMFKAKRQRGFSLIELLVSIVVFSVGLLAVAGLQTVSKSANFESLQRTTAAHIANGLLEDMRTNGNGIDVYLASPDLGDNVIAAEPVPNCGAMGSTCNAVQKAVHDLWFWEEVLDGEMEIGAEGATGGLILPTICIDGPIGGGAGIYTVTVAWRGGVSLVDSGLITCGDGSGKYGAGNAFRRIVQVPTFLDPNI
jgi:type IV pilus assembly protein PilV